MPFFRKKFKIVPEEKPEIGNKTDKIRIDQNKDLLSDMKSYMEDQGYNLPFITGFISNLVVESGLDPKVVEKKYKKGFGLAQLSHKRLDNFKSWSKKNNRDKNDWKSQLDFFHIENSSPGGTSSPERKYATDAWRGQITERDSLKNNKDHLTNTVEILLKNMRPKDPLHSAERRMDVSDYLNYIFNNED